MKKMSDDTFVFLVCLGSYVFLMTAIIATIIFVM
jgi:hypothetical protein